MKIYIKSSDEFLTEADYRAALFTLKQSANSKQVTRAQEIIKKYQEQSPEHAAKVKEEFNTKKPRAPRSKSGGLRYRW